MNEEKVLGIINDEIVDKITQVIELMSTTQFVEMICEKSGVDVNDEEMVEKITDLIGTRVIPLYGKMSEYIIGVDFYDELLKGK